jgi:hypothetical protein
VSTFVDPRVEVNPAGLQPGARTTTEPEQLAELLRLCRQGRVYDVERWIHEGRPLQVAEGTPVGRKRVTSALEIALGSQNHALVLLLLCNGYDPNLEADCPLDLALRARRWDLLDLLLEWGADPGRVNLEDLFGTYQTEMFERFRALGVDLTARHALAEALAYHTSNRPLFGFARRHRVADPKIQAELNIALAHHAGEGNEKGVQLSLWAGADPHAPALSLRFGNYDQDDDTEADEGGGFLGFSAIRQACSRGHVDILKRLGPDASRDDFDDLYNAAHDGAVIELLARGALPKDVGAVIRWHLMDLTFHFGDWRAEEWRAADTLQRLFRVGARWERSSPSEIANVRQLLLRVPDNRFVDLMKLFAEDEHCSSDILRELGRTPSIRARMKKVGFFPPSPDDKSNLYRPTRSREVLSRFGVEIPKPKKPEAPKPRLPRTVQIGPRRPDGHEIRMDRGTLFKRVWSEPVVKLAEEWGLSGRGLAKACRRLEIPVPPRGFWARLEAGQRPRRPRLAALPPGQADEVIIWAPESPPMT